MKRKKSISRQKSKRRQKLIGRQNQKGKLGKVEKVWFKKTGPKRQVQNDGLKKTSLNGRVKIDGSK